MGLLRRGWGEENRMILMLCCASKMAWGLYPLPRGVKLHGGLFFHFGLKLDTCRLLWSPCQEAGMLAGGLGLSRVQGGRRRRAPGLHGGGARGPCSRAPGRRARGAKKPLDAGLGGILLPRPPRVGSVVRALMATARITDYRDTAARPAFAASMLGSCLCYVGGSGRRWTTTLRP